MDLIDDAKAVVVNEGYKCYEENKVRNIRKTKKTQVTGYVYDSVEEPYYVMINLGNPKTSYCDCEYATGSNICKHMIALYFAVFKESALIYKEWIKDYYEEYEYLLDNEYYNDF